MAILTLPPAGGLAGPLANAIDISCWRGIVYARKMPQKCRQPGTAAQLLTWQAQRDRWVDFRLMYQLDFEAWRRLASGTSMTWCDLHGKYFLLGYNFLGLAPPSAHVLYVKKTPPAIQPCFCTSIGLTRWICKYTTVASADSVLPWSWDHVAPDMITTVLWRWILHEQWVKSLIVYKRYPCPTCNFFGLPLPAPGQRLYFTFFHTTLAGVYTGQRTGVYEYAG